ncbi:MAG: hypothetical protein ACK4WC_11915, partial [Rubrimonas sp.]
MELQLIDGFGSANLGNHINGLVTIENRIYSNFVTRGGAGSGGGAGLGGVFFVDRGATLVLDSVSFNTNTAIGGTGGSAPGVRIGGAVAPLGEMRVAVAASSDIGVRAAIDPATFAFDTLTLDFANPLIRPGMQINFPGVTDPVTVQAVNGRTVTLSAPVVAPVSTRAALNAQAAAAAGATTLTFDKDSADFRALRAGAFVTGTGVAPETHVQSIDYDTGAVTLSKPLSGAVGGGASITVVRMNSFDATPVVSASGATIQLSNANPQLAVGMFLTGDGIPAGARITSIDNDGKTLTLSAAVSGPVREFEAIASPGEVGGNVVRLPVADNRFRVGMAVTGEGVPNGAVITAIGAGGTELTLSQSLTAVPGMITASPIQGAVFAGGVSTITMADASLLAGLEPGMLLTGSGVPAGAVVQSVSGATIVVSGDLTGATGFTAASPLSQGGSMNGMAATGMDGSNGGAGRNGTTGFIDTEGGHGTRGIAGGAGMGGAGGAGGAGGDGGDGGGAPAGLRSGVDCDRGLLGVDV